MSDRLSVEEITAILLDEHHKEYPDSIPPKALYKILYFVHQKLEKKHIDAEIPYYWYMYGTKLKTVGTEISINQTPQGRRVSVNLAVSDIEADSYTINQVREVTSEELNRYYKRKLKGITNDMYWETPYEIQRVYRELDQQIAVSSDGEQATLLMDNNRTAIKQSLVRFAQSFPSEAFTEQEETMWLWYGVMSNELLYENFDPDDLQSLAKKFWRYFSLELALQENNDITKEEIEADRNIDDIYAEQKRIENELLHRERATARKFGRNNEVAKQAAEAFVLPSLEIEIEV